MNWLGFFIFEGIDYAMLRYPRHRRSKKHQYFIFRNNTLFSLASFNRINVFSRPGVSSGCSVCFRPSIALSKAYSSSSEKCSIISPRRCGSVNRIFYTAIIIVHGISNVRSFMEREMHKFDFVEVMACSGGCIGGGGQPINHNISAAELRRLRTNALHRHGLQQNVRLSCDNPDVRAIYDEFLGEPLGVMSKKLLHVKR